MIKYEADLGRDGERELEVIFDQIPYRIKRDKVSILRKEGETDLFTYHRDSIKFLHGPFSTLPNSLQKGVLEKLGQVKGLEGVVEEIREYQEAYY